MTAMTFAVGGLAAWVPTYLVRVRGMELVQANLVFGLLTLCSGLGGTLLGGWLGDRLLARIPAAYFLVSGLGLLLSVPVRGRGDPGRVAVGGAGGYLPGRGLHLPQHGAAERGDREREPGRRPGDRLRGEHLRDPRPGGTPSPRRSSGSSQTASAWRPPFWIAPAALALGALLCFGGMGVYARDAARAEAAEGPVQSVGPV